MAGKNVSIAIIGGGIGGSAAALSLLKAGFDVQVYEQARVLREVGAGIVLTPNVTRVLHHLAFAADLEALGVAPDAIRQRRWDDGRTLLCTPLTHAPGQPAIFYTSHRSDVLSMLTGHLPPERLHLEHRLTEFTDRGDRVELRFANGARASADIMIGADGIHSTVRELLFGAERPRFTGCVAYRGLVAAERLKHLDLPCEDQIWMGPGKHFVHYPVSAGRLVNFVGVIERDTWTKESWTERGEVKDAVAAYEGWHDQVCSLVAAVTETFVWGLFDRAPLARWSVNRVTLLGDACHPMLPFLAQGAAQAIEDGATLAAVLGHSGDNIPAALRRYEALRLPRTARIQAVARGNKTRNHLPDGPAQRARDASMAAGAADWSIGASAWVYEHDATAAADSGSLGVPADAG
jgi:2-polyprenyl-6-methoxyphenol hydroxylase-like FAD-dependent oxidoreductase